MGLSLNKLAIDFISVIESVLYYPIFQSKGYQECMAQNANDDCGFSGIPFLVLWIMCASFFFTFLLKFVNLRLFTHSIKVALGKYASPTDKGEITALESMITAIAATVGIGNIAGVAVAISLGGPGAVLWMVIMGFMGMCVTFSEVTLAQKYRKIDEDGTVTGGPFRYLRFGLEDMNMARTGHFLAMTFAIFCLIGAIGVSMFQTNQATSIVVSNIGIFSDCPNLVAIAIAIITALVLIGGIKRIAHVADLIVPFMAVLYIVSCLTVLGFNFSKIDDALVIIFQSAFDVSAVSGGMLGAIIAGVKRAMFSNEAGLGTTPIAHSAAKSAYPARQGAASSLNPFIDTVIICFMTGIVIVTTGAHEVEGIEGVQVTSFAFETVSSWFSGVLVVVIFLFAYSTVVTYGYYAANAWRYMFGKRNVKIYYVIYCLFLAISGGVMKFDTILRLTDSLTLAMCLPNLLGIYIMHKILKKEIDSYVKKLRSGEFDTIKKK
ncbi:MAG: amino acid carrier protein [Proteobacteria bacterium]|nr:amino acid carrier protein [Pseudomonadota bacterium]